MTPGAGPRPPGPPPPPAAGPDTDVARRVTAVLEREVNASIAKRGHAELAGIEAPPPIRASAGGCQGCGMATATLSQGIEVAIPQTVSEIDRVVDVTNHASGTNPNFEQAKE